MTPDSGIHLWTHLVMLNYLEMHLRNILKVIHHALTLRGLTRILYQICISGYFTEMHPRNILEHCMLCFVYVYSDEDL